MNATDLSSPSALDSEALAIHVPWVILWLDRGREFVAYARLRIDQTMLCRQLDRRLHPRPRRRWLRLPAPLRPLWRKMLRKLTYHWSWRVANDQAGIRPVHPVADTAPSGDMERKATPSMPGAIRLRQVAHPVVSVIIPTCGQVELTLRCLAAIAAHPPATPIEVVVVDDTSDVPAAAQLDRVEGIRVIRQPRNCGLLHPRNTAAQQALGDYLLFLSHDTEPHAGWLDAMLALARARPDVGAVGAKLVYPDGRLREAGAIVWSDGSGLNYGRGDDPGKPEYNYVRAVDYCSDAVLLVPRAVFDALGGFDPGYAPVHVEDTDLAFRLRGASYEVLYQPRAVVTNTEFVSRGTDITRAVTSCPEVDRRAFVARWATTLIADHAEPGTNIARARDRAGTRPVVLIVDHRVPEPDRDAGSRVTLAFIQALLQAGAVVKLWSDCAVAPPNYEVALQDIGIEVRRGPWWSFVDWIARNGAALDHALLCRPDMAEQYLPLLRRYSRARVAFFGIDLHHARMRQHAAVERDMAMARAAERMLRRERRVWRGADVVLYPSQTEADRVAALAPRSVVRAVQQYSFVDFAGKRRPVDGQVLLFVAGFGHPPNADATCWLVHDIMPLVRQRVPLARLAIVGSAPSARVRALAGDDVTIAADVSDGALRTWYASARVAVVPLRYGAGVKRKVVEALREGLPLVTTTVGAQGLPGLGTVAAVYDTPDLIAASLVALLTDDTLWATRSDSGIAYARAHFSTTTLRTSLCQAIGVPDATARPSETARRGEPRVDFGDVVQADMQPDERAIAAGADSRAGDEADGRRRRALDTTPGGANAEQPQRLDESVGLSIGGSGRTNGRSFMRFVGGSGSLGPA